jgi:hypothetical protein
MEKKKKELHSEGLQNLYSSLNIIVVIKLKKVQWAGHVARVEKREMHTQFWSENLKVRETTWEI